MRMLWAMSLVLCLLWDGGILMILATSFDSSCMYKFVFPFKYIVYGDLQDNVSSP